MGQMEDLLLLVKPSDLPKLEAYLTNALRDMARHAWGEGYQACYEGKQRHNPYRKNS